MYKEMLLRQGNRPPEKSWKDNWWLPIWYCRKEHICEKNGLLLFRLFRGRYNQGCPWKWRDFTHSGKDTEWEKEGVMQLQGEPSWGKMMPWRCPPCCGKGEKTAVSKHQLRAPIITKGLHIDAIADEIVKGQDPLWRLSLHLLVLLKQRRRTFHAIDYFWCKRHYSRWRTVQGRT